MVALMRRKEYAAQGRGWGMIGFGSGQFIPQMYQAFMRSQNLADAFATIFTRAATQAQIDFVNSSINTSGARRVLPRCGKPLRFRRTEAMPATCTVADWMDATTKYIDGLKTAEDRLLSDFAATVQERRLRRRGGGFWNVLVVLLGLLAVTCAICWFVVLSITRPVGQLVDTMATLAEGKNDIEVPGTERGDELGHMARAVLVFRDAAIEKNRLEAASADAAAGGRGRAPAQRGGEGRGGGAGQARRRRARRRARAARQGRAHLPDHRRSSPTNTRRCRATSTRPSPSCRRPSARS